MIRETIGEKRMREVIIFYVCLCPFPFVFFVSLDFNDQEAYRIFSGGRAEASKMQETLQD